MKHHQLYKWTKCLFITLCLLTLLFSQIPMPQAKAYSTNMNASVVIGQANFTDDVTTVSQTTFGNAALRGLFIDSAGRLIVADVNGNRILIWNHLPTSNGAPADLVLGQPDFTSSTANNGGRSARTLNSPHGVYSDGTKLFVLDAANGRVLIWNTFPTQNQQAADVVVGQTDATSSPITSCDATHIPVNTPQGGVWVYNNKLVVSTFRRILIWNAVPTTNGVAANTVLGQPNMTTCNATNPPTQASLNSPRGLMIDINGKLFVTDGSSANRVLIWNAIPTSDNTAADVVVGQADFISNSTTINAATFNIPLGVYSNGQKMFVADNNNHRVLIYNTIPTTNGASADMVLGQPDFTTAVAENGGRSASSMGNPQQVFEYQNKLLVSESSGDRILIFDSQSPTGTVAISSSELTSTRTVTLTLAATDDIESTSTLQMQVSNASDFSGASWETYATTKSWTLSTGDGTKTVYVRYKDSIGNASGTYSDTITLDTTAPNSFSISSPTNNSYTADTTPTIYWSATTDATTSIAKYQITIDSSTVLDNISASATSFTLNTALSEGSHTFTLSAVDSAGNTRTTDTVTLKADLTTPSGTVAFDSPGNTTLAVNLMLTATDPTNASVSSAVSSMRIGEKENLSETSWETYASTKSWTLSSSDAKIYAQFKDTAGNESAVASANSTKATLSLTSLGTVSFSPKYNHYYYTGHKPTFSGVAGARAKVTVIINSDPITCSTAADSSGLWSCTPETAIPNGEHTVTIQTVNTNGQFNASSFKLGINTGLAATGSNTSFITLASLLLLVLSLITRKVFSKNI